ncbi:MAG: BlaI/MecI/CopY family transcriptional regulator [Oscillospiraceae bacterium]|nr:BlaI/MecI/CopY family transcriptional regulator [Oscillospiraceae bacterium]
MERPVSLSAGEWRIMEHLWENFPRTLTELVRELSPGTGWSKSTIVTMVGRLEAKGAVTYTERGRARQYEPAIPREQAALVETESLLRRVYRGSVGMMVNTLADGRGLSDRDIEELSAVLEKARRDRK